MRTVSLGDVTEFVRGVTFKPTDVADHGVGVMRTKNVQQELDLSDIMRVPSRLVKRDEQYLREGDTLVSSANSWNAVGKACWVPQVSEPLAIGGFVTALRPTSSDLDPRYLYRWFTEPRTQATLRSFSNKTTNISNLNLKLAAAMPVPLPAVHEQRRIAAILDHADALRTRRRQVIARLDALVLSIFDSMFGSEPFPLESLGNHIADQQIGLDRRAAEQGPERAHDYVKMDAITSEGKLNLTSITRVDATPLEVTKYSLRDGDLLLNTRNSRELVGKSAVYRGRPRLFNNNVMRIRLDDALLTTYVHRYLWTNDGQSQLDARKSGTTSVFAVYAKSLATLMVPIPPVALQRAFADRSGAIDTQRARVLRGLASDDELFASLQSRAFRGEL